MSAQTPTYRGAKRYYGLKDARQCVQCSKPLDDDEPGALCSVHAEQARARALKRYNSRREAGQCRVCRRPLGEGDTGSFCQKHANENNKRAAERRQRRRDTRQCARCGKSLGEDEAGTLCRVHKVKHLASLKKRRAVKKAQGFCRQHNCQGLILSICPVCRYEQTAGMTARRISFEGLLPPPAAGDELDECVMCKKCGRFYHAGSSYRFPELPSDMKLRDEIVGDDPATEIILRFATGANERKVLAEFKGCSKPEEKCIRPLSKITARVQRGEELPWTCKSDAKNRSILATIIKARQKNAEPAQAQNDNGQVSSGGKKERKARFDVDRFVENYKASVCAIWDRTRSVGACANAKALLVELQDRGEAITTYQGLAGRFPRAGFIGSLTDIAVAILLKERPKFRCVESER